jgi:hypothetical protein
MVRWVPGCFFAAAALVAAVATVAGAQPSPQRPASDLTTIPIASSTATQELTVRWTPYPGPADRLVLPSVVPPADQFLVLDRRAVPGTLPRERNPQPSSDQLVAITIDSTGREVDWQLIRDPRVVRAETPAADGRLSGQVLHRTVTEFLLTLPAEGAFTQIRVYEPSWTGAQFVLRYLGAISLDAPNGR